MEQIFKLVPAADIISGYHAGAYDSDALMLSAHAGLCHRIMVLGECVDEGSLLLFYNAVNGIRKRQVIPAPSIERGEIHPNFLNGRNDLNVREVPVDHLNLNVPEKINVNTPSDQELECILNYLDFVPDVAEGQQGTELSNLQGILENGNGNDLPVLPENVFSQLHPADDLEMDVNDIPGNTQALNIPTSSSTSQNGIENFNNNNNKSFTENENLDAAGSTMVVSGKGQGQSLTAPATVCAVTTAIDSCPGQSSTAPVTGCAVTTACDEGQSMTAPSSIIDSQTGSSLTLPINDISVERLFVESEEFFDDLPSEESLIQIGGGRDRDGDPHFTILGESRSFLRNFRMWGREVIISLHPAPNGENPLEWFGKTITDMLKLFKTGVSPCAKASIAFQNENNPALSVHISYRRLDQLDEDVILDRIEKIVQSNDKFLMEGIHHVSFTYVEMPEGGRPGKNPLLNYHEFCKSKRSIVVINNDDNFCLPRAIAVGVSRFEDSPNAYTMLKKGRKIQKARSLTLCHRAGVNIADTGAGLDEVQMFQNVLPNYKITIFGDRKGREVLYEGPSTPTPEGVERKYIDLIYGENHFNVITSLSGAFGFVYYCRPCRVGYNTSFEHKCQSECSRCLSSPPCKPCKTINCPACKRSFFGEGCLENHSKPRGNGKPPCHVIKFCETCCRVYNMVTNRKQHVCNEFFCRTCKCHHLSNTLCYMKPKKQCAKSSNAYAFVFYDIECRQDDLVVEKADTFLHVPNLLVSQTKCNQCLDEELAGGGCYACREGEIVFDGEDPVADFLDSLVSLSKKGFKEIICLAHNAKAYDNHFLLRCMIDKMKWDPKVIMCGAKLICMSFGALKFLDSLNFMPMPLSKLPSAFGLGENICKGYFPHFFNTKRNANYVGPMPPVETYGVSQMNRAEKAKFITWYDEMSSSVFDMKNEIRKYCVQDVNILRLACLKLRKMFISLNDVDPFREAITIASACMVVFRKNHLREKTIGILPPGGYRWAEVQSKKAIQWILFEEVERGIKIQNAAANREVRLLGRKVDGFAEVNGEKVAFEFHGCFYHGCPTCFSSRHEPIENSPSETMHSRYGSTEAKTAMLIKAGYKVIEMWECQFARVLSRNENMSNFVRNHPLLQRTPLHPRDAFFGGRTNAVRLYHKVNETLGEKIKYFDVCSLYPFVNKYKHYPIGHPKIYVGDECPPLENLEGLVKCTVLPPRDLFHPVLPVKLNKKLVFPLCATCARVENQNVCNHIDEERQLIGTWVTVELKKAISKGYTLIKMHEAWHFEVVQYDAQSGEGGLFSDYINSFLKLKQEASGWPEWCSSEVERNNYIEQFKTREGIQLDRDAICTNPGLRSLAKLMLNSFWGKFGQRDDLSKTTILKKGDELYSLLNNPNAEVSRLVPVNEDILFAHWMEHSEAISPSPNSNIFIACYTTAHARMELYSYLEALNERVLYFDTDSIIFTKLPGEWEPPVGDFLGQLTDEISPLGEGCFISEFVSGGPKNYAYRVRSTVKQDYDKYVCKVRGITINSSNDDIVSFQSLKAMVVDGSPAVVVRNDKKISRSKNLEIVSRPERKIFRVVYTKRKRVDDFDTVPYGYKRQRF